MSRLFWLVLLVAGAAHGAEVRAWKGGSTPPLALKDMDGQVRTLDHWRGKVLVVNFWATWCEPCIEEMPSLQQLGARHAQRGLEVVAVNLGEGEARIASFLKKVDVRMAVLLDRDGVARQDWKVRGVPATFVIDRQGRVRYTIVGQVDFADAKVEQRIVALLPKPRPPAKPAA
ncbi:MAG: TlpA family protein disulfide reductase [Betaproteobacteria bacterium]|nr:TlpA family protein disulfide reductase [Betaproteobacteria bacterium]